MKCLNLRPVLEEHISYSKNGQECLGAIGVKMADLNTKV